MWIFGIGFFVMLCALSAKGGKPDPKPATRVSGMTPPSALQTLNQHMIYGHPVHPVLVQSAMHEAYRSGNLLAYNQIIQLFYQPVKPPEQKKADPVPSQLPTATQTKVGSPFDGVADDEWNKFAKCFATHDPTFKDDKHVGRFYHHKQRLAELGIDPSTLGDEKAQYQAFEADMKDTFTKNAKFINEFSGDSVNINGSPVSITRSGALALLKCAGPDNARAWLTDSALRMKFPQTMKIFAEANQLF